MTHDILISSIKFQIKKLIYKKLQKLSFKTLNGGRENHDIMTSPSDSTAIAATGNADNREAKPLFSCP